MPVLYGGFSLRPGPQVSLSKEQKTLDDGRVAGTTVTATLRGTIVTENPDGTHTPVDADSKLSVILARQREIRNAFSVSGKMFEVQGWDGSAPMKFNARVQSVEFSEGPWVNSCDYTIVLEGDDISGEGDSEYIDTASESWTFEEGESPRTSRVTHTVSAKGKTVYDASGSLTKHAWEWAREFVENQLGLGLSATSDWSPKSGEDHLEKTYATPFSDKAWSPTRSETIDELAGTYSVTETWILHEENWTEERTVSVRSADEPPHVTTTVAISGTIQGLYKDYNDVDARYDNALDRWSEVEDELYGRAMAAAGVSLHEGPISSQVDHDENRGSISYTYEYNNRTLVEDTFETYQTSAKTSSEDYRTTVSVEGTIQGVIYPGETSSTLKFDRAESRWNTVKSLLLARAIGESGVSNLKAFPVTVNVTKDKSAGTVSYAYEFDNRDPEGVRDEFTATRRYNKQEAVTTISIDGTITGIRTSGPSSPLSSGSPQEQYQKALSYFNGMKSNILGKAAMYVDVNRINTSAVSESVSHLPNTGQISYSFEYNDMSSGCVSGSLSESFTVIDDAPTPQIAIIPIPGRREGPIFQDLGTIKESRRTATAEIIFEKSENPCSDFTPPSVSILGTMKPDGNNVIVESDQTQWSPSNGRYTRTIVWIYT